MSPLDATQVERLRACIDGGGVAVFPSDTVYGLACDPLSEAAVRRLYELKGRPPQRPAAVMAFSLARALQELPDLHERERAALGALLPGPLTLLLENRARRFPLACGPDPGTLGLRVPELAPPLRALGELDRVLMQSSANLSGGRDARRLQDVPQSLRAGAELVLDGGELPGTASTVVDLRRFARDGSFEVVREGPVGRAELERRLADC